MTRCVSAKSHLEIVFDVGPSDGSTCGLFPVDICSIRVPLRLPSGVSGRVCVVLWLCSCTEPVSVVVCLLISVIT